MNLIEALEARGIEYHRSGSREDEVAICCPFCTERGETPDTRFRLGINLRTGFMGCFNCGKGSRSAEYTFQELERVLNTGQMELQQVAMKKKKPLKVKLPEDFTLVRVAGGASHWNSVAYEYLKRRGVTDAQIVAKGIGFSLVGDYRYRVVIPVYQGKEQVGLVARAFVVDMEPKYKNSLGEKVLYNVPSNRSKNGAVLVEGVFDALAVERACRNSTGGASMDALAVLGHALTERQLKQLEGYKRLILYPDPDVPGLRGFMKMADQLTERGKQVFIVVPELTARIEEYDPSDLFIPEMVVKLKTAQEWTEDLKQALRAKLAFQGE